MSRTWRVKCRSLKDLKNFIEDEVQKAKLSAGDRIEIETPVSVLSLTWDGKALKSFTRKEKPFGLWFEANPGRSLN